MNKPDIKHVTFRRNEGRFNWLNSEDVSAQYIIMLPHLTNDQVKEMDLKISFLVDIDKDYDFRPDEYTPLELMYEIKSIFDDYWIHTGKKEANKMLEYLESIEEDQEQLRKEHEIENAKYQIYFWQQELEKLNS